MHRMPKVTLGLENAIFLVVALYLYYVFQGNWLMFLLLLIVPDVSMVGYLVKPKFGAFIYNLVHNYFLAIILIIIAAVINNSLIAQIAFILAAHVAIDRICGFGLKYPDNFKSTHIQKL